MSDIVDETPYDEPMLEPEADETSLTTDEILHRNGLVPGERVKEEKKELDIPCCWSNLKNDEYAPAYVTVPKVPAGVYEIWEHTH